MNHYSVYEPSSPAPDLATRADKLAFVKDGFSWPALFFPAFWLIFHRMWIELIVLVAILAGLQYLLGGTTRGEELVGWATLAISAAFAFEANDLRTAALRRRGYELAGIAVGRDRSAAELSFFRSWLPEQTRPARVPAAAAPESRTEPKSVARPGGVEGDEVIGLFPRA